MLEKAFFQEARISIDPIRQLSAKTPAQKPRAWEQLPLTPVTSFFLTGAAMSLRLEGLAIAWGAKSF